MTLMKRQSSKWLRLTIIFLLVLGISFRLINLDRKVYWHDEAATSLRITGSSWQEMTALKGVEMSVEEFQNKFLRTQPQTSVIDVFTSSLEDPHITPLYYFIGHFWIKLFGDSVAAIRSLSVVMGLLALPCIYWLCLELFSSSLTAGIAVALMAVSPFHILYAQEARMYSLWTVTILLSCIALLRAMRIKTPTSWRIYAVTLCLSLYTHLFTVFVAVGHGIYVATIEKFRLNRTLLSYFIASLICFLFFTPWLLLLVKYIDQAHETTNWTHSSMGLEFFKMFLKWSRGLNSIFFDSSNFWSNALHLNDLIQLPMLLLVGYSFYFAIRYTAPKIWLFILILQTTILFVIPSLVSGTALSLTIRYQIPSLIGIGLAVAYLIASKISSISLVKKRIWQVLFVLLIVLGIRSNVISSQSQTWWIKGGDGGKSNIEVARLINQAELPLLIGNNLTDTLSLSYLLNPDIKLQLTNNLKTVSATFNDFTDVFVFRPSNSLKSSLEQQQYHIEYIKPYFWKLILTN